MSDPQANKHLIDVVISEEQRQGVEI